MLGYELDVLCPLLSLAALTYHQLRTNPLSLTLHTVLQPLALLRAVGLQPKFSLQVVRYL